MARHVARQPQEPAQQRLPAASERRHGVWLSILARRTLEGASFTTVRQLRHAIDAFICPTSPPLTLEDSGGWRAKSAAHAQWSASTSRRRTKHRARTGQS